METTIFAADAKVHHATRAAADKLAQMLKGEYPALTIRPVYAEHDENLVAGFIVEHRDAEDADPVEVLRSEKAPKLADILDACEEQDLDPEAIEAEEEEKLSGSVVPEQYRKLYREVSTTGRSCGDWLAEWLAQVALDGAGKADIDALVAIFNNNGLDMTAKWAKVGGTPGWQGRFRMNGRQVLEKHVAKSGALIDAFGEPVDVPAEEIAALQAKHAKWLAKQAKIEAAQAEVSEAAAGK